MICEDYIFRDDMEGTYSWPVRDGDDKCIEN
jgi:hypothetical protein